MTSTMVWRSPFADGRRWLLLLLAVALLGGLLPAIAPQNLTLNAPIISQEQALNTIAQPDDGWSRLMQYRATYAPEGLTFKPRFGGPSWEWRIAAVNAGTTPLANVNLGVVTPAQTKGQVDYNRGAIIERYLERDTTAIEQQFIIPAPLALNGRNLEIVGAVSSPGTFAGLEQGWEWRTDEGRVTLGDVTVFDATGAILPATMEASAGSTRIVVDGAALSTAAYPVTVDPLIGADNFAITSHSNQTGNLFDAMEPAAAYNPVTNQYLVVFAADGPMDAASPRLNDEFEIYGQFVDATTGALAGPAFRISRNGNDLPSDFADAMSPDVAYSTRDNLFLVTWAADNANPDGDGYNTANGFEIYTQAVSATGQLLINGDDRISSILAFIFRADLTDDGIDNAVVPDWDAFAPSVAYSDDDNGDFLVCWSDDRNGVTPTTTQELLGGRYQIRCKRFIMDPPPDNSRPFFGAEPPNAPYTISSMRPTSGASNVNADAYTPDVVYNSVDDQWMVVWSGDDINGNQLDEEFEIFGQVLDAAGNQLNAAPYENDRRFTRVGGEGGGATCSSAECDGYYPTVAFNPERNLYLAAYTADTPNGSEEVYYSLRSSTGNETTVGVQEVRLSQMGGPGTSGTPANLKGLQPDVAYDAARNEWMVVWRGDGTTNEVFQIYGQRLDATTPTDAQLAISTDTTPISKVGDTDFLIGSTRTIAPNSTNNQGLNNKFLLSGTSNTGNTVVFDADPLDTRLKLAPSLAATGTGGYLVVWTGNRTTNNTGTGTEVRLDIFGRLMDFNEAPTITDPADIGGVEATSAAGAVVNYELPTATDPEDGALIPVCVPASGSTFALGSTTVTCTATDSVDKSAETSFSVTVVDTTDPTLTVPTEPVTAQALVPAGIAVTYETPTATDLVDAEVAVSCTPSSGSVFAVGDTTVNCTATDDEGNVAEGSFTVSVAGDTVDPVLDLPEPITAEATGPSGAVVTYTATATDTIDTEVSAVCTPASGSTFALGATTVNCTATDDFANEGTGSFTVTVEDTTNPSLTVPANIATQAEEESGKVVTFTAPSATDTVDTSVTIACTSAPTAGLSSGSVFPVGETTITCVAEDDSDNTETKSFTVTVAAPNARANLGLTISNLPATVQVGTDLSVTFSVSNSGPNAASGTTLTAPVPGGMSFKSGTAGCALQGGQVRCAMNSIANGASKSVTIVFSVNANATTGVRTISGSVSAAEADPTPSNNVSSDTIQVVPEPDPEPEFRLFLPILFK